MIGISSLAALLACGGDGSSSSAPPVIPAPSPTPTPGPTPSATCRTVTPDVEMRCPYHPIDGDKYNITFTSLADGTVRMADGLDAQSSQSEVLFDPQQPLGWGTLLTVVSPGLDRALTAKQKMDCSSGGPECFTKLWYVYRDENDPNNSQDDEWVHINLSSLGLGEAYEAHGWSTWLHNDLALFNVHKLTSGPTGPADDEAQIYALRLDGVPRVERYAPDMLEDQQCLTGRINAQPARVGNACFDGQRISLVRRCKNEQVATATHAWWNVRQTDDPSSGTCLAGPQAQIPVLRTYVMEVDQSCAPKKKFSEMQPAHIPDSEPENKTMGVTPEWGDMLSAISGDGKYLAIGVNRVDPGLLANEPCAGFKHNLTNPDDDLSGNVTRHTHICELSASLRCIAEPVPVQTQFSPIENLSVPGFLRSNSASNWSIILNRVYAPIGQAPLADISLAKEEGNIWNYAPIPHGTVTGVMPIHKLEQPR